MFAQASVMSVPCWSAMGENGTRVSAAVLYATIALNPLNAESPCVTRSSSTNSAPGSTVWDAGMSAAVTPCAPATPGPPHAARTSTASAPATKTPEDRPVTPSNFIPMGG